MEKEHRQVESSEKAKTILTIFLQRHGPKLSAAGEKNELAKYFSASVDRGFDSMNIKQGQGLVHISSSPVKRAVDTAEIEIHRILDTRHRNKEMIKEQAHLEVPFQPISDAKEERYAQDLDIIVRIQKEQESTVRKLVEELYPDVSPEEKEAEVRNIIDMRVLSILFDQEQASQYGLKTSYEELADNLAQRYQGFLRHISLLTKSRESGNLQPKNEPYIQIDISHSFPITCFLKKYLVFDDGTVASEMPTAEFFDKTGGIIRESGSLRMDYQMRDEGYFIAVQGEFSSDKVFNGEITFTK